ncbi:MAG: transcription initiation factor IIB [Nitrososphaeraceae archaeon]
MLACSTCNTDQTAITDPESGEIVCSKCGLVISKKIEDYAHQERRAYSMQEADERARTGARTSLAFHDMGLSTIIGKANKDASGQLLNSAMCSSMDKLRIWDSRIHVNSSEDRSLRRAFHQLNTLRDKLGLSDTLVEKSAYLYRKAQERGLIRGRTVDGIMTAAVYIACRETGTPKSLEDISIVSNLKRKDITRCYRRLVFDLDIKIPIVDPMKCIVKVANKLSLSEKTKNTAMNLMTYAIKMEINAGKIPMGLAATVLYASCLKTGENVSQTNIAEASGVTEVTIRNRFKDLTSRIKI